MAPSWLKKSRTVEGDGGKRSHVVRSEDVSAAQINAAAAYPAHNTEIAPDGALAGSGWQFQGEFGSFLGTAISSKRFITAAHVGVPSSTFVSKGYFNGGSDASYSVNASANGGLGYYSIAGTDLRIFEMNGTFSSFAPLYTGTDEVGKSLVVMGRGTQRGATVDLSGVTKGWRNGTADQKSRWGTNVVSSAITSSGADYLAVAFNALSGTDEAHLTSGDSGGAVFIQDGGGWKLAGINYAVDGSWDFDGMANGNGFSAALFDAGGVYLGSDDTSWTLIPDQTADIPSGFYSTRISSYLPQINAIVVPEPSIGVIGLVSSVLLVRRKRVRTSG